MDQVTVDRLRELAPLLQKFLDLHPDEQEWLMPLLGRAERRAITILQEIDNYPLTYRQVGELTTTHPSTVKQTLNALSDGGMNFRVDRTGRWVTPYNGLGPHGTAVQLKLLVRSGESKYTARDVATKKMGQPYFEVISG